MIWDVTLRKRLRHSDSQFELDVSFASDAPRLVLFGPSGAGKTQTLRMLAGIGQAERGRVAIGGRVLYDSACGVDLTPQRQGRSISFRQGLPTPSRRSRR